jgi:hypothetical protein
LREGFETRPVERVSYNWFDKLAINHLSKCFQAAICNFFLFIFSSRLVIFFVYDLFCSVGLSNNKSGFDSFVETATVASQKFKI